ncbi:Guanosine-3',5'-bis(diphosphate) 3'-pyrophosphohydrolase MESH1 [Geranomyces variabilis]|nr:Guanosine-3',5'-bis(diphosphate) 3'-pyrophosphohydrolase MESH1 [Geranomyces variabilis]
MSTEASLAALVLRAAKFASQRHAPQRRKDPQQTPYINHPLAVACVLADEAGVTDPAVLQAALLHDTVEDTPTSLDEIEQFFGADVRLYVAQCSDDTSLPKAERKRLQIETAPTKSDGAKLVKLADKIDNLRDLQRTPPMGWTLSRVQEYFAWAKQVTDGCVGVSPAMDSILAGIYAGEFEYEGRRYPCLTRKE